MTRLRNICLLLLSLALPSMSNAQTLSGRLTSSLYAFQRSDSINIESSSARGYQAYQIDFSTKNILVRSYGQFDTDFSTPLAGDGKARMYNLYLEWKNIAQRVDVQFGRQPVFGGVAVGTIDGAQIKVRAAPWLRLKAFGGGLLPADQRVKVIDDFDQNYMAGGQAVWTPKTDLNLSLSFFDKRQLRPGYDAQRADSVGNVFTLYVEPTDRASRLGSLDASWFVNAKTSLYARSDYDFHAEELARGDLSVRAEISPEMILTGNYIYRSPRLPWNSIFSAFNVEDNHEVEGGFYYQYRPSLRLYGNAAAIFYSGDESLRLTVGTELKYGGVSYVHRGGYAGNLDGLNASFYYPTRRNQFMPSVQLSWATYKLDGDAPERESLFSGAAGLLVRPMKKLTLDGQFQLLHNRYYKNDVRFMFRLQYWFFTKLSAAS
ncbi:MAG: hypothetical protein ACREOO_23155 [bacterium]